MSNIHVGTARMRTFSITMYTKSHKSRGLSRAAETGKRITKRTSRLCSPQRSSIEPLIANAGWLPHDLFLEQGCLGFPFLARYPHQEVQPMSSDASSPRSDGDSSRDN